MTDHAPGSAPLVPISWGELFDKISILEIKVQRVRSEQGLSAVHRELHALLACVPEKLSDLEALRAALKEINEKLWKVEDELRLCEPQSYFDRAFITLARSVYVLNDKRAALKREINAMMNSPLVEVKQHPTYFHPSPINRE